DIPVKQVMIEARIVIVNDDYRRDLGVRFGANVVFNQGGNDGLGVIGNPVTSNNNNNVVLSPNPGGAPRVGGVVPQPNPVDRYLVNLPVANPAGRLALTLLDSDYLVDLELSA